jgi:hypothetical protein
MVKEAQLLHVASQDEVVKANCHASEAAFETYESTSESRS